MPLPWAALGYLAMLVAVMALFMGRKWETFHAATLVALFPGFYSHVSNLCIAYLLYTGIGYPFLMAGGRLRVLAWGGLGLVAANLAYESFIPVLNTRDPIDAAYGVAGTATGLLVLWVLDRWGLVPAPAGED
ncbi:hypothetical protein [Marilutibacter aestuarii]|uniref:VanZ-like domain-containing protein n=1 Tax=Marilutibacter aestuarii TaxID=1706195 RepID=A0A508A8L2_9GAMM|nr:hypothetical protein [Lysobacter aestuarii]TQD43355.1 hypothetical protein FKV25_10640 [Lysobacter aestuarii]